jgi:PAS domain S-box-containing protein
VSTASVVLPPDPTSPGQARRLVRRVLDDAGRPEWSEAAELAVTELVTNAALHAHTEIGVSVVVDDARLRVEVRDGSPVLPGRRQYDAQATTGRGMALVGALASDYGVSPLEVTGKVVWFEIDGRADAQSEDELLAAWSDSHWDVEELAQQPDDATRPVVLLQVPPTLWLAARQHHDALLRELVLYLAEHDDVVVDLATADLARGLVSSALVALVDRLRAEGVVQATLPDGHPSPLPWAPPAVDLELRLPPEVGPGYGALQDALDVAERLAVQGLLLVRPGLPEVVTVRDWVCEQVQSQLLGVAPTPWPGTADERFETAADPREQPDWDLRDVLGSGRGVVAADDANRVVGISPPLADALGWAPEELVGRRVVTLIPPALREAHVAGFTRHLTTGEAHVLGVPLVLPVLRADGGELRCRFLVEQRAAAAGRALYLAWIEPVDAADDSGGADGAAAGRRTGT